MKYKDIKIKMRNTREEVRGIENTLKRPCMQWGRGIIRRDNS